MRILILSKPEITRVRGLPHEHTLRIVLKQLDWGYQIDELVGSGHG